MEGINNPPIRRSFIINKNNEVRYEQKSSAKKSGKKAFIVTTLLIVAALAGGVFFGKRYHVVSQVLTMVEPAPTPTPTPTPVPLATPEAKPILNRADWSFEVLNGSGTAGLAKKIADQIKAQGYVVVKTGNAEKNNYRESQILVRGKMQDQVDLVVADLRDIIKIASVAGELTEGTASAQIIIGKN